MAKLIAVKILTNKMNMLHINLCRRQVFDPICRTQHIRLEHKVSLYCCLMKLNKFNRNTLAGNTYMEGNKNHEKHWTKEIQSTKEDTGTVDDVTILTRQWEKWKTQWQQIKINKTREAKPNTVNSKLTTKK